MQHHTFQNLPHETLFPTYETTRGSQNQEEEGSGREAGLPVSDVSVERRGDPPAPDT